MQGSALRQAASQALSNAENKKESEKFSLGLAGSPLHGRRSRARTYSASGNGSRRGSYDDGTGEEDDGNLDPSIARQQWLDTYAQMLARQELSLGELVIALQEIAARYVALESKVLSFGVERAKGRLNKLRPFTTILIKCQWLKGDQLRWSRCWQ